MKAEMPWTKVFYGLYSCRRVGSKMAGVFVELELIDLVGSPIGDVRNECKPVGWVGLMEWAPEAVICHSTAGFTAAPFTMR